MKPGTFTQMYVHLVFAVKNRDAVLTKKIQDRVFSYISKIITESKHKSIIVNGTDNHVHILLGINPAVSISDTVHAIKRSSSLFINRERLCSNRFAWQEGYGGFTCSRTQLDIVYKYIQNQESHHRDTKFKDEYVSLLIENHVEFESQFLFNSLEDNV